MLGVDRRVVDTQAAYRDEVTEYWFANSEGTLLHELRPEVTLSAWRSPGTAACSSGARIDRGSGGGWLGVKDQDEHRSAWRRGARWRCSTARAGPAAAPTPWCSTPSLAGVFVHEAIGHLSEADFAR